MHNDDAMKKRDDRPLTKEDAKQFATKDDLKLFATKDDLKLFATKDDLAGFAAETRARFDTLEAVVRRQTMAIVNDRADRDSFREELISMIKTMDSRNAARADAFMSNTLRVDHDNILLVHRMDTVEGRVAALERRTP